MFFEMPFGIYRKASCEIYILFVKLFLKNDFITKLCRWRKWFGINNYYILIYLIIYQQCLKIFIVKYKTLFIRILLVTSNTEVSFSSAINIKFHKRISQRNPWLREKRQWQNYTKMRVYGLNQKTCSHFIFWDFYERQSPGSHWLPFSLSLLSSFVA